MTSPRNLIPALLFAYLLTFNAAAGNIFPQLDRVGDDFTFVVNADPHVNNERPDQKTPSPHNELFRRFIGEVNAMAPQPAFVLFNGDDFERQAAPTSTRIFLEGARRLKALPILAAGNHDVRTDDVATIFAPVQQALNGTSATQFGFDCGQWHFAVLPPLELITPENERETLDALDRDLKANAARPTMIFLHYHILPVGLSQLEFYTYPIPMKRRLLDVLARYGNVKYVFSGHVHSGIQPSLKTAWTWKGINFFVAPSPVKPRPFGEEFKAFTMEGGDYLTVEVKGKEARLVGRQTGNTAIYAYPPVFREFKPGLDPRALTEIWDLPANDRLVNGDFNDGLQGWLTPCRYLAEREPGYMAHVQPAEGGGNEATLTVKSKGQNWAYGEFNELYQIVKAPRNGAPLLALDYAQLEARNTAGGYAWLAGMKGNEVAVTMIVLWGPKLEQRHFLHRVMSYLITGGELRGRGLGQLAAQHKAFFWDLPGPEKKARLSLNAAEAYDAANGAGAFQALGVEKYFVGVGVWCTEAEGSLGRGTFDGIALQAAPAGARSTLNGQPLAPGSCDLATVVNPEPPLPARKMKKGAK